MPSAGNSFRIKLEFEAPPPGMPCSRKCMILVKTDQCKTIYDLGQTIIQKFGFSKGATTNLALEGFNLVPTEDIAILSNNDCVSVSTNHDAANSGMSSNGKKRSSDRNTEEDVEKSSKLMKKEQTEVKMREKRTGINEMPKNSGISKKANVRTRIVTLQKRKASSDDSSEDSTTEDEKRAQQQLGSTVKGNTTTVERERTEARPLKALGSNSPICAAVRRTIPEVGVKTSLRKSIPYCPLQTKIYPTVTANEADHVIHRALAMCRSSYNEVSDDVDQTKIKPTATTNGTDHVIHRALALCRRCHDEVSDNVDQVVEKLKESDGPRWKEEHTARKAEQPGMDKTNARAKD